MTVTLKQVNAALAKAGHAERLVRGNGYFYFAEGGAPCWRQSGVYVSHLNALTVDGWLNERDHLANDVRG